MRRSTHTYKPCTTLHRVSMGKPCLRVPHERLDSVNFPWVLAQLWRTRCSPGLLTSGAQLQDKCKRQVCNFRRASREPAPVDPVPTHHRLRTTRGGEHQQSRLRTTHLHRHQLQGHQARPILTVYRRRSPRRPGCPKGKRGIRYLDSAPGIVNKIISSELAIRASFYKNMVSASLILAFDFSPRICNSLHRVLFTGI